jgi:hypothetical protein
LLPAGSFFLPKGRNEAKSAERRDQPRPTAIDPAQGRFIWQVVGVLATYDS